MKNGLIAKWTVCNNLFSVTSQTFGRINLEMRFTISHSQIPKCFYCLFMPTNVSEWIRSKHFDENDFHVAIIVCWLYTETTIYLLFICQNCSLLLSLLYTCTHNVWWPLGWRLCIKHILPLYTNGWVSVPEWIKCNFSMPMKCVWCVLERRRTNRSRTQIKRDKNTQDIFC